ncbi:conserved hypothetical protein [Aeromonas veronii]|uniref:Uncharacterized protein n=1 Tax=Aeromonas veronii TaxID=654 RepID=A0A653KXY6_AERVE|nr:conserved hypothetical protein [Aeromonas veronii]
MRAGAGRYPQAADARLWPPAAGLHRFSRLAPDYIRQGVLALASHTGWSLAEISALRTSRFIWWIKGLPKDDG